MPSLLNRFEVAVGWYPKNMPSEERKLVRKLDGLVLTYACLSFFAKYLDVSALTNAYVSGMKDDLDLYGNRLNYINAAYEVGYVVFQIPSNLLISRFPAQYYLPAAEIFWGLFTLGTAFVQNYNQLVVMRFFVGFSATSCYVGLVHIVNSWYRHNELGRRNALFWIANPLGQMIAGYIQAAAYTNLNNHHGLQGWRWLFIICFVITIPIACVGIAFFPDMPDRTKSRWLTDEEKKLAVKRLREEGFAAPTGINRTLFKRVVTSWRYWAFVLLMQFACNMDYGSGTPFILWLDSQPSKYSVALVNNISTVTNATALVSALVNSYYTDLRGKRYEALVSAGVLCLFANIVLAVWNIPTGLKFFAYIAIGWTQGVVPIAVSWVAENFAHDMEARSVALASYNCFGEVSSLVVPLVAWQVSHAPTFHGGYIWAACISVAYLANLLLIIVLLRRDEKRANSPRVVENGSPTLEADVSEGKKSEGVSVEEKSEGISVDKPAEAAAIPEISK